MSGPGDMKATRNAAERAAGGERPKLSLQQYNAAVWRTGATHYGADKYARGNYHGPPPAGVDPVAQVVEYLDAAMRHLGKVAQAVNVAYGTGGDVGAALACVDDDASGGFPPSMLPHLAHAIAGLSIMVEIGVAAGFLPADPGQPWKQHPLYAEVLRRRGEVGTAMPQKNDPDEERRRILDQRRIQKRRRILDQRRIPKGDRVRVLRCDHAIDAVNREGELVQIHEEALALPYLVRLDKPSSTHGQNVWCAAVERARSAAPTAPLVLGTPLGNHEHWIASGEVPGVPGSGDDQEVCDGHDRRSALAPQECDGLGGCGLVGCPSRRPEERR